MNHDQRSDSGRGRSRFHEYQEEDSTWMSNDSYAYTEHDSSTLPETVSVHSPKPTTTDMSRVNSYPPKESDYLYPNNVERGSFAAPEVVKAYTLHDEQQQFSPFSPSSHEGSTLVSPGVFHRDSATEKVVDVTRMTEEGRRSQTKPTKKRWLPILAIAIFIVLGLGLGLGLGLTLTKKSSPTVSDPFCQSNPDLCIGGYLDDSFYSRKGAFNGSGIAVAGESWNKGQKRIFTLYFQHWSGDLRYMQYTTDRKWIGGEKAQTVASDAKNATPISTVAYTLNGTAVFHLFYVSKDNLLRQKTWQNDTNIWDEGLLNKLDLSVYDNPTVGLQACWKGNFYGDSDYTKFPTPSGLENQIHFSERKGMDIWYALDDNTFQQYSWYEGQDQWKVMDKWLEKNTHAGVACYSWGEGNTTYAMMVNQYNGTEMFYKDTDTSLVSTDEHPINSWRNISSAAIANVYPSTSMGFTTYFYAQMEDKSMKGFNLTFAAENTTLNEDFLISDPAGAVHGLAGTHLTMTAYAEKNGNETVWDSLYVFYQTGGDDITAFTRPIKGGEWTKGSLQIPVD